MNDGWLCREDFQARLEAVISHGNSAWVTRRHRSSGARRLPPRAP